MKNDWGEGTHWVDERQRLRLEEARRERALCDHPQREVVGHGAKTGREITWCGTCAKYMLAEQAGCEGTAREPDPQTTSGAAGEGVAAYLRSVPREKTWTCPAEGCGLSWPIPEAYCTCGHQDQDDYESWRVVELTDKQDSFITNSGGLIQHKSYIATIDPEDSRTWALCWVRIPEENDSKP